MKNKIIVISLLFFTQLYAPQQQITTAGSYLLGEDIPYAPSTTNDSIIQISASNVFLDLGKRILSQTNTTAGLTGISIDATMTNVIITNGFIQNVTGTGITVNRDCSRILIDNVTTFSCDLRGINFTGISTSPVIDSEIRNCSILNCCRGAAGDFALNLLQCNKVKVTNCNINNNGISTHNLSVVRVDTSLQCDLNTINALSNTGSQLIIYDVVVSSTCSFTNCMARSNSTNVTGVDLTAFKISGAGNAFNIFTGCSALENAAATTNPSRFLGFDLATNSFANLLQQCIVIGNTAATVDGFRITGPAVSDNVFIECLALRNAASGAAAQGTATGFSVNNGADFSTMLRCIGSYNTSTNTVAQGIVFQTGTGGNNWSILDCDFSRNIGNNTANSFGINETTGVTNLISRCRAFNNGTTATNQLNISEASFSRTTNNLTGATGPWGPVGIVP